MDPKLREWLLEDDAPHPGEALDDFAEWDLPPGLAERTLAAVHGDLAPQAPSPEPEPANRRFGRAPFVVAGLAVAAALLLVVGPSAPQVGDVSQMTSKGASDVMPVLELKMASERDGQIERLRRDRSYESGDRLYFRYTSNSEGWVHLIHATEDGVEVLHSQPLPAGEDDLRVEGGTLHWELDEGDTSSSFALVRTEGATSASELGEALQAHLPMGQAVVPETFCAAAQNLGLACDAAWVEVTP